jgi:hypothetical protein
MMTMGIAMISCDIIVPKYYQYAMCSGNRSTLVPVQPSAIIYQPPSMELTEYQLIRALGMQAYQ